MPQAGLTIGSDARFDILTPQGLISLPTLTRFDAKKINQKMTVKPLNGFPIQLVFLEGGWQGSFSVSRADNTLDAYFAAYEAAYYAGANLGSGVIQQTINEISGVPSVFQFQGVVLEYADAGDYEAEKNVMQSVSFFASTRIQL